MIASELTLADSRAARNFESNRAALRRTQPWLVDLLPDPPADLEWVLGRDGALTALDGLGRWWAGCSVPKRAAETMLRRMDVTGAVACFLLPPHAWHVQIALEKLPRDRAVLVVEPELSQVAIALRCVDFSKEIAAHRLWILSGDAWADQLRATFQQHPGLATPTQFIRMPSSPADLVAALVEPCTRAFQAAAAERLVIQKKLFESIGQPSPAIGVLRQSAFKLWNSAALVLGKALASEQAVQIDQDDPLTAAPLALAQAATGVRAVVTANLARSDLPNYVRHATPWITWVTHPRIPPPPPALACDVLLLADERWRDIALAAGWGGAQIRIAGWPVRQVSRPRTARPLAIISDTLPLDCPDEKFELSSHTLLWRKIVHELSIDPLQLRDDSAGFLDQQMKSLNIAPEGLDRRLFIERVIFPAYQQGVAKVLIGAGLPLMLAGSGWEGIDGFAQHWAGPVESVEQLRVAADASCAIVHALPATYRHQVDSLGVPVVRTGGADLRGLLRETKSALAGDLAVTSSTAASISMELIDQILIALPSPALAA